MDFCGFFKIAMPLLLKMKDLVDGVSTVLAQVGLFSDWSNFGSVQKRIWRVQASSFVVIV